MRGTGLITLAALVVLAVPAQAQAQARTVEVTVANNAFTPADVRIVEGDVVTWHFTGPDTNHSATSQATSEERGSFDSDPGNSAPNHQVGDKFTHQFEFEGEYPYFCKVHPEMTGRIVVQARINNSTPPPVDTAAPRFGTLRVNGRRRRASFRLNEAADVTAKLRGPTRRALKMDGRAGSNVLRLPKRLKPGRYALTLRATDAAGNAATPVSRKFRVPKRR